MRALLEAIAAKLEAADRKFRQTHIGLPYDVVPDPTVRRARTLSRQWPVLLRELELSRGRRVSAPLDFAKLDQLAVSNSCGRLYRWPSTELTKYA